MITKEDFVKLIEDYKKWDKQMDKVCDVLGANMYELDWISYTSILFDTTIDLLFTEEARDDISWWLWEKAGRSDMKMWDKDGVEIPTETIDDLWELVKNNRK